MDVQYRPKPRRVDSGLRTKSVVSCAALLAGAGRTSCPSDASRSDGDVEVADGPPFRRDAVVPRRWRLRLERCTGDASTWRARRAIPCSRQNWSQRLVYVAVAAPLHPSTFSRFIPRLSV